MSRIENTSERDPVVHLAGMIGGTDGYIAEMEAAGQRQLVGSTKLPTDLGFRSGREDYEALGFVLGDPDPADPMFMEATLPPGWRREGSDHAMWSYLVDERGIKRVSVFYKAAFYDRSASMSITNVGYALASETIYADEGHEPAIPWGVLTAGEREDLALGAEDYLDNAETHPSIYGDPLRVERARRIVAEARG